MAIKVLHLEDDPADRELVFRTLRTEGIECILLPAVSRDDFERALSDRPDLILSDYSIPGFGGDDAQELARARCPDVPFLFVSGSIGEERAVERLKSGATDYVLKDRLNKLGSAVKRALREAEDRRQRDAAEAELRALNAQLEARVAERTAALTAANRQMQLARAEADRANRAKSDFLSRMSHDLRTPMNAIMGFAQLLQMDPLTPDQVDSVSHILRGGEHLLNLINEVLDIARIEAGRLTLSLEPVSAAEVSEYALSMVRPLAAKRGIELSSDVPDGINIFADRQRVTQILLNLLSNAVKYNRDGGRAALHARIGDDTVRLDVIDTGAGIPPEKLALLFTPFERLGAEQSGIEGTGLGLALAKRLAHEMKGDLTVSSVVDRGTTFALTLPLATDTPVIPVKPSQTVATAEYSGTVLYVEDNVSNALLMERLLMRRPGVRLLHATEGLTGLDLLHSERPDLIILDLHLSDVPGEEVLRRIWADPATRDIPVAVLSADATSSSRRRLLSSGATAYLTKPFDIAEVLALIDRIVGHAL